MDSKDCLVWHSPLDTGWSYVTRPGIQAEGIRGTQATMGSSNTDNSLLRFAIVFTIPPSNPKSRLILRGTTPHTGARQDKFQYSHQTTYCLSLTLTTRKKPRGIR